MMKATSAIKSLNEKFMKNLMALFRSQYISMWGKTVIYLHVCVCKCIYIYLLLVR